MGPGDAAAWTEVAGQTDVLARYLEVLTREWPETSDQERLAAVGLALETARRLQGLLKGKDGTADGSEMGRTDGRTA